MFEKILTAQNLLYLLNGLKMSLIVAALSFVFGTILGVIGAAMKISDSKILKFIANTYVDIIRGTPMLLQILFIYLGLPLLYRTITGSILRINPYVAGTFAISFNSGAYTTELIRSSIQAIDKGLNGNLIMTYDIVKWLFGWMSQFDYKIRELLQEIKEGNEKHNRIKNI